MNYAIEKRLLTLRAKDWKFILHPAPGYSYNVFISRTRQEMQAIFTLKYENSKWRGIHFRARTIVWEPEYAKRTGNIGDLIFNMEDMGAGLVAHEMTHATIAWAALDKRRMKIWERRKTEELFATVLDELVRKFWGKFWDLKLDKISIKGKRCH